MVFSSLNPSKTALLATLALTAIVTALTFGESQLPSAAKKANANVGQGADSSQQETPRVVRAVAAPAPKKPIVPNLQNNRKQFIETDSDSLLGSSSFLGGAQDETGPLVASDGHGGAWVVCSTTSADAVLASPFQNQLGGETDVLVTHVDAAGQLVSCSYLGGLGNDSVSAIVSDGSGGIWIVGSTISENFPVVNPFQATRGWSLDAFAAHVGPTGELLCSSYLGGSGSDTATVATSDGNGGIWVAGSTYSDDLPLSNAFQSTFGGGIDPGNDSFVGHVGPDGSLVSCSYLGGSMNENVSALAPDNSGGVWLTGSTDSFDFPVANAFQNTLSSMPWDAFVTHVGSNVQLLMSSFLGGDGWDYGQCAAPDGSGGVWVGGYTESTDLPLANPFLSSLQFFIDGFVSRIDLNGNLVVSTYIGGDGFEDFVTALAADGVGGVWVVGRTDSANFPVVAAVQGSLAGMIDAFAARIGPTGNLLSSTYLGGSGSESFFYGSATSDGYGGVWFTFPTQSTDVPTLAPFQPVSGGGSDVFLARLASSGALAAASYLGGDAGESVGSGALCGDGSGGTWLVGGTASANLPLRNPFQAVIGGATDGFVAHVVPRQLRASVALSDFDGEKSQVQVEIQIRNPGSTTALETHLVNLKSDGTFAVPTLLSGTYDVAVKATHWLRSVQAGAVFGDVGATGLSFTLANGDCDGDNTVNLNDYTVISRAWRSEPTSPNWNPNADLNGDGTVNLLDRNIVARNWRTSGAP